MKGTVLFIDTVHPVLQLRLEAAGWTCEDGSGWDKQQVAQAASKFHGFVIRSRFRLDRSFLEQCRSLRFIARAGAGMENIDVTAAEERGILCLNAPEGNRNAVAEHALGMLLSLMNHLVRADSEVRKGIWLREENRGTELDGKTVGIIGFGNTGAAFASKLRGFDVRVLAYDPYITLPDSTYPQVLQTSMEDLQAHCDIVSLHVPLTDETDRMVDEQFLTGFSKPIYLINTSRGKVVDTAALVDGLESGRIKGAALDVLEFEKSSFEQLDKANLPDAFLKLIARDDVLLSPHIAGWTIESHRKLSEVLAEKILARF